MAQATRLESFQTNIMDLPEEVLLIVFSKLSISSILTSVIEVCTSWKSIIDSDFLFWKELKISIDCNFFLNQKCLDPPIPPAICKGGLTEVQVENRITADDKMISIGEGDLKKVHKVRFVKFWNFSRTSHQPDLLLVRILEIVTKTCNNIVQVELDHCLGINSKHFLKRLGEHYKDIYELKFGLNSVYMHPYEELVHFKNLQTFVSLDYLFVGRDLNTLADGCNHLERLWIINAKRVTDDHFISFLDKRKKVIKEIGIGFRVTDNALCKIEECKKLETLFIGDARGFTEAVLESINKLENLRNVSLQRAKFSPEALANWILYTKILTNLFGLDLTAYYHKKDLKRWSSDIKQICLQTGHRYILDERTSLKFIKSNLKKSQAHWMFRTMFYISEFDK